MADPAQLRERARELRETAVRVRAIASDLGARLPDLRVRYPLPDAALWSGPNAETYSSALRSAEADIDRVVLDVIEYAEACDARALGLEREADLLEPVR